MTLGRNPFATKRITNDSTPPHRQPHKMARRRLVRKLLWIFVPVLLLAGILSFCFFDYIPASLELPQAAEQYRRAGFYWTQADFAPNPPIPDEENAWPLIAEADATGKWSDAREKLKPWNDPPTPADLVATQKVLTAYKPEMDLLEKASQKPYLALHLDLDRGFLLQPPMYGNFKAYVKLFAARARVNAERGRPHLAAQDLATALRLTQLLGSEANAFNYNEQIACDLIILRTTEYCVQAYDRDPSALTEFSQVLEKNPVRPSVERAMKLEAFLELATLRNLNASQVSRALEQAETADLDEGPPPTLTHVVRDGYPDNIVGRAYLCRILEGWTSLGPALQESASNDDAFDAALAQKLKALNSERRMSYRMSQTIFPVFDKIQSGIKRGKAQELCDRALIQALIFRDEMGHFPTETKQLPGPWIDPFTKTPLHVKLQAKGFRIYSLGPDGVDHGGVAMQETENNHKYNFVAAFPPVKNRSYVPTKVSDD